MKLEIQYKLDKNAAEWSVMTIPMNAFNEKWDDEEISTEIMEYVYTNINEDECDDDPEEKCVVNDMSKLIATVEEYFNKENRLTCDDPEDFYRTCQ